MQSDGPDDGRKSPETVQVIKIFSGVCAFQFIALTSLLLISNTQMKFACKVQLFYKIHGLHF